MVSQSGYLHLFFPGFGIIMQLILLVVFLSIIYWVIKSGKINDMDAEEILKKRLAKGEISKKEYKELLEEIK